MFRRKTITALVTGGAVAAGALAAHDDAPASKAATAGAPAPPAVEFHVDMAHGELDSGRAIILRVRHTPNPQEPHRISVERTKVYVRRSDTGPIEVTTATARATSWIGGVRPIR